MRDDDKEAGSLLGIIINSSPLPLSGRQKEYRHPILCALVNSGGEKRRGEGEVESNTDRCLQESVARSKMRELFSTHDP